MKKNNLLITFLAILLSSTAGCSKNSPKTLNIIFTNDVHCAIDSNIGYAGVLAYKNSLKAQGNETLLVDCGDHIQGAPIGSISKGSYIIEIMNAVGYEYATPGNHEFDYTAVDFVNRISKEANFKYLSSNFISLENNQPVFAQYEIVKKADYRIGLVGISTPSTIVDSSPKRFKDSSDNYLYTFLQDQELSKFYENIQNSINQCIAQKADYVIALAHLGTEGVYNSTDLIKNVTGLDVLLDGHSHSVVTPNLIKDKSNKDVIIAQTGTELNNIGNITIVDNKLSVSLVNKEDFAEKDTQITNLIKSVKERYESALLRKIGHTNFDLTINDSEGKRLIRKTSTNMGDLVSDALKSYGSADIALHNGGGIRANISAGDITYKDAMTVCPFGNVFTIIKATGQMIKDFLEFGAAEYPNEHGQLLIPSGLTYSINANKQSTVEIDNAGTFVKINGEYRVENILVNGNPLDLQSEYTIAGTDFNLCDSDSAKIIFKNASVLPHDEAPDYDILATYIENTCAGEIPAKYSNPLGEQRITITQ